MAITPSATAINRLKRMTAATIDPIISDGDLSDALVLYAVADGDSNIPGDALWTETFDYNGAAAEVWGWKEAAASVYMNSNADGSALSLNQITANCREQKLYYQNLRSWGTITTIGSGT